MIGDRFEDCVEFRPGELSVWTGINGHGKSMMLNQVLIGCMLQGERVCVFSGEMPPPLQGKRLVRQLSGIGRPTPEYIDAMADWVRDRMWIFNQVGTATVARLIDVFRYASKRYGITHFVIDSLMTTDVPDDGPGFVTAQKSAVQKLAAFAKESRVHVHLVAHPRKGRDESSAPGKMDVSGSGKITDGADNVFSVWSARKDEQSEDDGKADALLELHKQRNGDVQSRKFWMWFNVSAQQYCASVLRRSVSFVPFNRAAEKETAP
jgi:twinkle protein